MLWSMLKKLLNYVDLVAYSFLFSLLISCRGYGPLINTCVWSPDSKRLACVDADTLEPYFVEVDDMTGYSCYSPEDEMKMQEFIQCVMKTNNSKRCIDDYE